MVPGPLHGDLGDEGEDHDDELNLSEGKSWSRELSPQEALRTRWLATREQLAFGGGDYASFQQMGSGNNASFGNRNESLSGLAKSLLWLNGGGILLSLAVGKELLAQNPGEVSEVIGPIKWFVAAILVLLVAMLARPFAYQVKLPSLICVLSAILFACGIHSAIGALESVAGAVRVAQEKKDMESGHPDFGNTENEF